MMSAKRVTDEKARDVARKLHAELLAGGCFTFSPMPMLGANDVVPAAGEPGASAYVERLGFSGLAVQSVGYERGAENPKVHVYVTKGSAASLRKLERTIEGITVQVNNVGNLTVKPQMARSSTRHGRLYVKDGRIACGSSCAPTGENYSGTFGALVRKIGGQELYILSNNHVLAACNHTVVGMPILAPSSMDGRPDLPAPRSIGRHSEIVELRSGVPDLVPTCRADVALALAEDEAQVSSWQGCEEDGYDTPIDIVAPFATMMVKKFGRTTGFTTGVVESYLPAEMALPYATTKFTATVWFQDVWTVRAAEGDFALPGDSGSLVITEDGRQAVGIIFAVDRVGRYAHMAPMDYVRTLFGGIELVGGHGV
jgi:hypothetical protein